MNIRILIGIFALLVLAVAHAEVRPSLLRERTKACSDYKSRACQALAQNETSAVMAALLQPVAHNDVRLLDAKLPVRASCLLARPWVVSRDTELTFLWRYLRSVEQYWTPEMRAFITDVTVGAAHAGQMAQWRFAAKSPTPAEGLRFADEKVPGAGARMKCSRTGAAVANWFAATDIAEKRRTAPRVMAHVVALVTTLKERGGGADADRALRIALHILHTIP